MIELILGGGIVVAIAFAYEKAKTTISKPAATRISNLQAEIEQVVATNSLKIEETILGELSTLKAVASTAIKRSEDLLNTDAVGKDVVAALQAAGTHLANAVKTVEDAVHPRNFPNALT